jgi:hypothetical protein
MPELVDEGITGFLVDGVQSAVAAVGKVGALDRAACRRMAQARFSDRRMVADYEQLFSTVADTPMWT